MPATWRVVTELNPGEGAFYGPKLEFTLKDSIERHWQCGTIQVAPNLPERLDAARSVATQLKAAGIRVTIDEQNQKLGYKIREAEGNRTPFILVVGEKEATTNSVSVRQRGAGDLGANSVAEFVEFAKAEIEAKR